MTIPALTVFINGQGQVDADNLNTFIQSADVLDDLRIFEGIDFMCVYVRGATAQGDGGQGMFYWNSTSIATDDNSNVIAPTGVTQGRWLRLSSDRVFPLSSLVIPVTVGGTADALLLTPLYGAIISAYVNYQVFVGVATLANTTSSTARVGTNPILSIKVNGNGGARATVAGDIIAGDLYFFVVSTSGNCFFLIGWTSDFDTLQAEIVALQNRATALEALETVTALDTPVSAITIKGPAGNATINWGSVTAIAFGATSTVTLKRAYPNTSYSVTTGAQTGIGGVAFQVLNKLTTAFDLKNVSASNLTASVDWMSIGGQS